MYEQDYIMRMNAETIKVMARLLCRKEVESLADIERAESKNGNETALDFASGQAYIGDFCKTEKEILQSIEDKEERSLERALLFYSYLNGKDDEYLRDNHFSHDRIKEGLKNIAGIYGISAVAGI